MGKRNDVAWMERLEACKAYAAAHGGRVPPQKLVVDGIALGSWFNSQNVALRSGAMPEERRVLWVDFISNARGPVLGVMRDDVRWLERFDVYKRYVMEHLKFPVISAEFEGVKIGEWVHNQLYALQDGRLPKDRLAMLDSFHPAWKMSLEARRNAEKDFVRLFDWHCKVPDGDVRLDAVLSGPDLQACLVQGVYGCRQYLERFSEMRYGKACAFWDSNESAHVMKRFGEGVFSLENRRKVFETLFPKTSFLGFNLICGASGSGDNGTYVQEAERYNRNSPFWSSQEMLDVIRKLIFNLPDSVANVLCGRYEDGLTFMQIANDMGVSRARVHQIESKWLSILQETNEWRALLPLKGIDSVLDNAFLRSELTGDRRNLQIN